MKNGIRRALLALLLVGVTMALGALVAQAGGGDPYFETRLGPVPERPVETEPGPHGEGDLLDWSGVNWKAWADSLGPHPVLALVLALVGMGIVFVRREGWVDAALSELSRRTDTAWNRVRQNRAGWWMTEILRRTLLPPIGAVIWAVKLVVSLPGLLAGALDWMFRRGVENALTVAAFVRADKQGKAAIIADQVDQFKAGLEQAKAFPGLLWDDVRTRWSRGLKGYVRIWQDPNVTNAELLQWGADHASMVADGTASGGMVGSAIRTMDRFAWFHRLNAVSRIGEGTALAQAAESMGISGISTRSAMSVLRRVDNGAAWSEAVRSMSQAEQDLMALLLRKGTIQLESGGLRFASRPPGLSGIGRTPDIMTPVEARYQLLTNGSPGYNVTPKRVTKTYARIGRNGTFLTDAKAVEDIIGPVPSNAHRLRIAPEQARELETALGLEKYSIGRQSELYIVDGIKARNPRRPAPKDGNRFFLGEGVGLPGGGPEVLVDSIPSSGGPGVRKIFLEVKTK